MHIKLFVHPLMHYECFTDSLCFLHNLQVCTDNYRIMINTIVPSTLARMQRFILDLKALLFLGIVPYKNVRVTLKVTLTF